MIEIVDRENGLALHLVRRETLRGADLRYTSLHGADLYGADMAHAILRGADLRSADLRGANLRAVNLQDASLAGASLHGADLRDAILCGAALPYAELPDADLNGACLVDANVRHACLAGADLSEARLQGADLSGANLCGADLTGALLQDAVLRGALYDRHTWWPSGFDPRGHGARPVVEPPEIERSLPDPRPSFPRSERVPRRSICDRCDLSRLYVEVLPDGTVRKTYLCSAVPAREPVLASSTWPGSEGDSGR